MKNKIILILVIFSLILVNGCYETTVKPYPIFESKINFQEGVSIGSGEGKIYYEVNTGPPQRTFYKIEFDIAKKEIKTINKVSVNEPVTIIFKENEPEYLENCKLLYDYIVDSLDQTSNEQYIEQINNLISILKENRCN